MRNAELFLLLDLKFWSALLHTNRWLKEQMSGVDTLLLPGYSILSLGFTLESGHNVLHLHKQNLPTKELTYSS